jgi:coenzyme F420-reducing hydrogenase delta subunit
VLVLEELMDFLGIAPERLQVVWVSSAEGARFARKITRFINQIRSLGPFPKASSKLVA